MKLILLIVFVVITVPTVIFTGAVWYAWLSTDASEREEDMTFGPGEV